MNLNINLDTTSIMKDIEAHAKVTAKHQLLEQIDNAFAEIRTVRIGTGWTTESGFMYDKIKNLVQSYLESDKMNNYIEGFIENKFQAILEEELEKAMRLAAEHKARQYIFNHEKIKNPREMINPPQRPSL